VNKFNQSFRGLLKHTERKKDILFFVYLSPEFKKYISTMKKEKNNTFGLPIASETLQRRVDQS